MDPREPSPTDNTNPVGTLSSAEKESQRADEAFSTKRELKRIFREDSNWSIRSISITALTGVSVAVIATQLNGLVSSFVLIAVMAFITASVSEIYRVFLALTGLGAKRAAAKAARVIPLLPVEQRAAVREEIREELKEELRAEHSRQNPITDAIEVVSSAYKLNEEQEAQHPRLLRRISYRLRNYGNANPFLWLVVLFLGIALTTVSVAYLVTDGAPPRIIQRTVVAAEELPVEDREAIVDEAKERALRELETQQLTPTPTASPDQQAVLDELNGVDERLSAMEAEIIALQATEALPTPSPSQTEQSLIDRVNSLEAEREALAERITELEAAIRAANEPQPTAPSSPAIEAESSAP